MLTVSPAVMPSAMILVPAARPSRENMASMPRGCALSNSHQRSALGRRYASSIEVDTVVPLLSMAEGDDIRDQTLFQPARWKQNFVEP
jgi:hypothetical protein